MLIWYDSEAEGVVIDTTTFFDPGPAVS